MTRIAWILVCFGLAVAIVGLLAGSVPFVVIGLLVAIAVAAIPDARRLELDLARGKLVIERESVVEAAHDLAIQSGMDEREAGDMRRVVEDRLPPTVLLERLNSGSFSGTMPDGSTVVVPIEEGETPTEQLLAMILAEEEISELLAAARERRIDEQFPRGNETWGGPHDPVEPSTFDYDQHVSDQIADKVSEVLDPRKTLLIHPGTKGRSFRVLEVAQGAFIRIGRLDDCDVVLADPTVSREHALIQSGADGTDRISDRESSNGVRVNGRRIDTQVLHHMDLISICKYSLLYWSPMSSGRTNAGLP